LHYLNEFKLFILHLFANQRLIIALIKNEFKKSYLGSYLGLFWAFVQPVVFMSVIWFVFEVGFRTGPVTGDTPFVLWLIAGMIPWFFLSSGLSSGTNAVVSNAFLVKKVAFRTSILPLVQIGSEMIIHLVLVGLLLVVFLLYGYTPTLYWLQLLYYIFCTIVLLLGLTWLTSAIRVFVKDIGNFITVVIQIGFWATPIFWSLELVPQEYRYIFELNPAFYIVEGFRDSLIAQVWFWEKGYLTPYFLMMVLFTFVVGAVVFRKLRVHFGDVL
jgi:lipopolysaccharide transport system permease protein/teichoic acid transport system permease protein